MWWSSNHLKSGHWLYKRVIGLPADRVRSAWIILHKRRKLDESAYLSPKYRFWRFIPVGNERCSSWRLLFCRRRQPSHSSIPGIRACSKASFIGRLSSLLALLWSRINSPAEIQFIINLFLAGDFRVDVLRIFEVDSSCPDNHNQTRFHLWLGYFY